MKTTDIIKTYKYIESLRDKWGDDKDSGDYYADGKEPLEITGDGDDYVFHLKTYHDQPRQIKINKYLLMRAAFDVDEASVAIDDIFAEALKETAEEAEARRIKHEEYIKDYREKYGAGNGGYIGAAIGGTVGALVGSPLFTNYDEDLEHLGLNAYKQTLLNSWLCKK